MRCPFLRQTFDFLTSPPAPISAILILRPQTEIILTSISERCRFQEVYSTARGEPLETSDYFPEFCNQKTIVSSSVSPLR